MEPLTEPRHTAWPFPFVPQDWEHTPTAVQAYAHTLQDELTRLRAIARCSCHPQWSRNCGLCSVHVGT